MMAPRSASLRARAPREGDQGVDLLRLRSEFRHHGVAYRDPLGEGLGQIFDADPFPSAGARHVGVERRLALAA